jgi:predicted PurR-regulated permease PerM
MRPGFVFDWMCSTIFLFPTTEDIMAFLNNVNGKKLAILLISLVVYFFATDFLVHGVLMKSAYQATAPLWRTEAEIQTHMGSMMLGQFLVAIFTGLIFIHGYNGGGIVEGVRFGILMAGFAIAPMFINYAVSPIPENIHWAWVGCGVG